MCEFDEISKYIRSIHPKRRPAEKDALVAWVSSDRSLSGTDHAVFNSILRELHWDAGHTRGTGRAVLEEATRRHRSTVSKSITKLKKRKYIVSRTTRIGAKMNTASMYTFPPMRMMHVSARITPYPGLLEAVAAADLMDKNASIDDIARLAHTLGGQRLMRSLLEARKLAVVRYWFKTGLSPGEFARILYRHAAYGQGTEPISTWSFFQAQVDEAVAEGKEEAEAAMPPETCGQGDPNWAEETITSDDSLSEWPKDVAA